MAERMWTKESTKHKKNIKRSKMRHMYYIIMYFTWLSRKFRTRFFGAAPQQRRWAHHTLPSRRHHDRRRRPVPTMSKKTPQMRSSFASRTAFEALAIDNGEESDEETVEEPTAQLADAPYPPDG